MTSPSLSLPENPEQLADWLEALLCSEDLAQAAVDWEVLAGDQRDSAPITLERLSDTQLAEIDAKGLKSLPEDTLRQLMASPVALLELQEHIFAASSPYWQTRLASQPSPSSHEARWSQIERGLDVRPELPESKKRPEGGQGKVWTGLGIFVALAASIAVGAFVVQPSPTPKGWGFNQPGILETAQTEDQLLETLADAAHAWFNKRPQTREELVTRLKQFDAGCQTLLSAKLAPLSPEAHQTVDAACQKTRQQIATYLTELEQGSDLSATQAAADQTMTTLEQSFRQLTKAS